MNAKQRYAVTVERFAAEHHVTQAQAIELGRLARRAFKAGERAAGVSAANYEWARARELRAAELFEDYVRLLGFKGCDWPGLWPVLQDSDGRDVYTLPI